MPWNMGQRGKNPKAANFPVTSEMLGLGLFQQQQAFFLWLTHSSLSNVASVHFNTRKKKSICQLMRFLVCSICRGGIC